MGSVGRSGGLFRFFFFELPSMSLSSFKEQRERATGMRKAENGTIRDCDTATTRMWELTFFLQPVKVAMENVARVACGADFSVAVNESG